jgi:hypothetical protein
VLKRKVINRGLKLWVSGILLMQAAWMIDFAHNKNVGLPLLVSYVIIAGYIWYGLALIYQLIAGILITIKRTLIFLLVYVTTLVIQTINYLLSPTYVYPLAWNDIYYFMVFPIYLLMGYVYWISTTT